MNLIDKKSLYARLKSFALNDVGSVAVEFALLVPLIMIPLYVGMVDLTTAYMAKRKLTMAVYQTSNILGQYEKLTTAQIDVILEAGKSTIYPLPITNFTAKYSLLKISNSGSTVVWSYGDSPRPVGDFVTVEPDIIELYKKKNLNNMVYAESSYASKSTLLSFLKFVGIDENYKLGETYYTRPRIGETITVTP